MTVWLVVHSAYYIGSVVGVGSLGVRVCESRTAAEEWARIHTNGDYFIVSQEIYRK